MKKTDIIVAVVIVAVVVGVFAALVKHSQAKAIECNSAIATLNYENVSEYCATSGLAGLQTMVSLEQVRTEKRNIAHAVRMAQYKVEFAIIQ